MDAVAFRDPPSADARAAEIEREIARVLLRAPTLPVDLPLFKMSLLGVSVIPDAIELSLGRDATRIATVHLAWSEPGTTLSSHVRWDGLLRKVVDRQALDALSQRLRVGVTRERWDAAAELAEQHRDLPRNVPLEAFRMLVPGSRAAEGLVRTGFNCNQNCGLCWQGRHWGRIQPEQILRWIEDLRAAGAETLIISGGEPTLDAALPRYIDRAKELGFDPVTLETNAIQMAKAGFAERLRGAGLDRAFVSLHSGDAAVSDAVTRAPGTHGRTVLGVKALLAAGVRVALNAVITIESIDTLGALPDFIRGAFGDHPLLETLVISDLGATYEGGLLPGMMPEPDRTRAALRAMIDRALALGLTLNGLGGPCGPQLCMFGADERVVPIAPIPGPVPFRVFVPACDGCSVKHACFGVRPAQIERFGEDYVRPVAGRPHAA